jgi:hypothetical protein
MELMVIRSKPYPYNPSTGGASRKFGRSWTGLNETWLTPWVPFGAVPFSPFEPDPSEDEPGRRPPTSPKGSGDRSVGRVRTKTIWLRAHGQETLEQAHSARTRPTVSSLRPLRRCKTPQKWYPGPTADPIIFKTCQVRAQCPLCWSNH